MPKELTHWMIAAEAAAGLPHDSALKGLIERHSSAYLAGAVLPDTLLYLHSGPSSAAALGLADRFHDTAGSSYAPLCRAEQRCGGTLPAPLMACLLGIITHMRADIRFHPFVYSRCGTGDMGCHYRLETDLDLYFQSMGGGVPLRRLDRIMTPGLRKNAAEACRLVFDPDGILPDGAIEESLDRHCRLQALFCSRTAAFAARLAAFLAGGSFRTKRHLFYPCFGSAPSRSFPTPGAPWRHPATGIGQQTSVEGLRAAAAADLRELFGRIEAHGSIGSALGDLPGENLLTGLHGVTAAAMGRKIQP